MGSGAGVRYSEISEYGHSAAIAVATLSHPQRRRTARELTALLGDDGGFSPDAFVIQQREAPTRWRPLAEKRVASTGAWPS